MTSDRRGATAPGRYAAAHVRTGRHALLFLAVAVLAVTGCASSAPTPAPETATVVPIAQTPWPNGTVGQYGLHIVPSLLGRLPASVMSMPIVEDAASEESDLADQDLPKYFDAFAAGAIGQVTDTNWLNIAIGTLDADAQNADFYTSWVSEYATGACSQADGVQSTTQETINDWNVDVAACAGGPIVYTMMLDQQTLLSMYGMGPLDLGRRLIGQLH